MPSGGGIHAINKAAERLHRAIGYVTPHEAEEDFCANMNALEKAA